MIFFQILLVSWVIASACSLVGIFLVLKKAALLSDAICHAILLGIVVFALLTKSITSPLLLIGAGLSGIAVVFMIEVLSKSRLIPQSVSMGIMYPLFFSIAIILINVFGRNVHIDTHSVVIGEIAFTPFDPWIWQGISMGPKAFYIGLVFTFINAFCLIFFYKQLSLTSFDPVFASTVGISPLLFHYLIMGMASFTSVAAFSSIGAILVVAFIIIPPATAFLLSKQLKSMIYLSLIIAILTCTLGVSLAFLINTSISGAIASLMGITFLIAGLFSPSEGILWKLKRTRTQKNGFLQTTLLIHLHHHQDTKEEPIENTLTNLIEHFHWSPALSHKIIERCQKKQFINVQNDHLKITHKGKQYLKTNGFLEAAFFKK